MTTVSHPSMHMIILAAGKSTRFTQSAQQKQQKAVRKQFSVIGSKTIISHCLETFFSWKNLGQIILVLPHYPLADDETKHLAELRKTYGRRLHTVTGGEERHHSVLAGLTALKTHIGSTEFVGIHDVARPFVSHDMLDRLLHVLQSGEARAVLPVLSVADTIKRRINDTLETLKRDELIRAQTPQCFVFADIFEAHQNQDAGHISAPVTDDCSLIEAMGGIVKTVDGDKRTEKITTFDDLQGIIANMKTGETRTGSGYDVHKFSPDKPGPIMICGIAIPYEMGLDAHSDGDVGLHAACDALFGALADGDIGSHFPPSEPKWKDKSSDHFLTYALQRVAQRQGELVHLDITLICEHPKIGPYREQMRQRIADICGCDMSRISVKATTSEGLGFTGRREGLAAMATATIKLYVQEAR